MDRVNECGFYIGLFTGSTSGPIYRNRERQGGGSRVSFG